MLPVLLGSVMVGAFFCACEKKPPRYELKAHVGDETSVVYDSTREQPEWLRKATPEMIRKYREEKKLKRKMERGFVPKQSRWDP